MAALSDTIIAECPQMKEVLDIAEKVKRLPWVTVLVCGETGTGKEVVARYIHDATVETMNRPFVEINCSAIPETMLESEIFGYEKGAFTDAKHEKKGLLEMANGGTFFLDEIGEMSMLLQAKFLKVIEGKRCRRLGGTADMQIMTRVIAATNADLGKKVENGEFRTDLFYRLNVINIDLPPLRKRRKDIFHLANYFLKKFSVAYNLPPRCFSAEAIKLLMRYKWPGNVRELKNLIERIVVLNENTEIDVSGLYAAMPKVSRDNELFRTQTSDIAEQIMIPENGLSLHEAEAKIIGRVLHLTNGNKTQASNILGISRPRLYRKIREYKLLS